MYAKLERYDKISLIIFLIANNTMFLFMIEFIKRFKKVFESL